MEWVGLIMGIIELAQKLTQYLEERQKITAADAANATAILDAARSKSSEITKSMDAAAAAAGSSGLPDPYQRD